MSRTAQPSRNPESPSPIRGPALEVVLPELHEAQAEVFRDSSRFKIVCCGRQFGKTTLGAVACVDTAARGGTVWWVAPSFPVGELGWMVIEHLCRQIPGTRFEGRPIFRITLPTGGTIQLRSADNPDSLRGATLDGVVFDEAAAAKVTAWPTLRPTLSIRRGWAMFISTPIGQNWFFDLWNDTQNEPGWMHWRFPSSSSPFMSAEEFERAKRDLSTLMFLQEYEAQFVSAGAGIFKAEWFRYWHESKENPDSYFLGDHAIAKADCRTFCTVDLAWSLDEHADYTVISTWTLTPDRRLLLIDCVRGHYAGPAIVPLLRSVYERHQPGYFAIERTTAQLRIVKEAQMEGLPVREVRPDKDKVARALPATARLEHGNVWFPRREWMRDLEAELVAFPMGKHDDFVDTLAYAVLEGATAPPPGVIWV